jgi:hypothetical protein
MKRTLFVLIAAAVSLLAISAPLFAHHGTANYDMTT